MTAPFSVGFPDYGRYSARAAKTYFDSSFVNVGAAQTAGPFYVGDVPYLGISATPTANNWKVQVQFGDTSVGFSPFGGLPLYPRSDASALVVLPVLGPYVRMICTPTGAGSTMALRAWASWTQANSTTAITDDNILVSVSQATVASGATLTTQASVVWLGEVAWNFTSEVATFRAWVNVLNDLGTPTRLDTATTTASGTSRRLFLPGRVATLNLQNLTGAAGVMGGAIVGRPLGPGY